MSELLRERVEAMNNGYIKVHRCIMKSAVWENESLLKVWLWCLLKASHEEREAIVGNIVVPVKAGQFVFGRKVAAIETGFPESTVWKRMKTLEKAGMIGIQSNNKFSVVTVENWGLYQCSEADKSAKRDKRKTSAEQQRNTDKNVKNVKNIVPPTIEMVEQYCLEQNLPINPQKFMDYYDSNGWKVGKSKMKDWQATVRSWARREAENSPSQPVQEVKKYKF